MQSGAMRMMMRAGTQRHERETVLVCAAEGEDSHEEGRN